MPSFLQGLCCILAFVNRKIVEDDDVTGVECGRELCSDIGIERDAVHGVLNDPGRGQAVTPQGGNEGLRSPMSERCVHVQSLTTLTTAEKEHHFRIHGCFVNKHKAMGFQPHPRLTLGDPDVTVQPHRRACAFRCHQGFFYM